MKRNLFFLLGLVCAIEASAQVGIGTLDPNALLDIRTSNQAAPASTDGLLIPKIDEFPAVNPSVAADGMLVFATGSGSVVKGFYYWNNILGSWSSLGAGVSEWTANGGNIERQSGNVYIGDTNTTNNDLYVSDRIIDWDNSSYFLDPGSASSLNEISMDDGSASDPSIYFSQADTGFFSSAADQVSYSANGVEAVVFDPDGRVEFLNTSEANQNMGTGVVEIGGSLRLDGNEIITNQSTTLFLQNGNNGDVRVDSTTLVIDASQDFVGVGQVTPHFTFDVDGPVMLEDTTAPAAVPGHSGIYSNSGELYAIDESGNSTVISPHHFGLIDPSDPMAWSFYSTNKTVGEQINVDMFRVVRLLEEVTGEQLIYKADLKGKPIQKMSSNESLYSRISSLEEENLQLKQQLTSQKQLLDSILLKLESMPKSE